MQEPLIITGKYLGAGSIKTIGQNNKQIRSFWIDITDNIAYPNTPEFQLWGDKVNLVDGLQKGQTVQVKFNLNGRKYAKKDGNNAVATNLDAWQINVMTMTATGSANRQPVNQDPVRQQLPTARPQPMQAAFTGEDDNNDLPF